MSLFIENRKYRGPDTNQNFIIPTNEELLIARDTVRVVSGAPKVQSTCQ
jgi:hypothetical protein